MWRKRTALTTASTVLIAATAVVLGPAAAVAGGRGDPIHGDVDGDGLPDRVYLGVIQPDLCSVIVEYGLPDGGYRNPRAYGYLKPGGTGIATRCPDLGVALDLDWDGVDSLVLGWFPGPPATPPGNLIILGRDFMPAGSLPAAIFQPTMLGTDDFNGDGRLDVYAVTDQGEGFETHLNLGDGRLTPGPQRWCAVPRGHLLRDLTHDGATEVVIPYLLRCDDFSSGVVVLRTDGSVIELHHDPLGEDHWALALVYADADNILDLRTTSELTGTITSFIGAGDGTFGPTPRANGDSVTRTGDRRILIDVLANDLASREALLEIVEPPTYGRARITADRQVAYTPDPGSRATDRFTYRITENGRQSVTSVYVRYRD
ncbi:Ig-like domain-containing protein [Solwaraspora sp. WMMD1047]|uniref:Ig-like domain-containing protein n=1 Tax=Solwaraspora sp. WMMD1047 TaxID=3016102 RepID=UPI002416320D|nr:Ig-like domain-containing protein [Solwaraspora sp. WMMD1047]MDG4828822.1 Ig-like domain-containing protein [Solwaraspora sp. WMMD1047]